MADEFPLLENGTDKLLLETTDKIILQREAFKLSLSSQFADGDATTVQLTAPATKSTSDFVAGKMSESSNPASTVPIDSNKYTEMEFCLQTADGAVAASQYEFRLTYKGAPLETISATPKFTVGSGATTSTIQKSLKYTIIRTPSALTKSAKYAVVKTPTAATKSLRYAIGKTTNLTKSGKYTVIKSNPITRSLTYALLGAPVNYQITESLKYCAARNLSATKSARYTIAKSASIQKAMKYVVSVTPSPLTRSLAYAVQTTPGALTKSARDAIGADTLIDLPAQYCLLKSYSLTKGLTYQILSPDQIIPQEILGNAWVTRERAGPAAVVRERIGRTELL
jgi:hypothetical protein